MTLDRHARLLKEFRRGEAYAAWVVEQVLGVRIKARDVPGAPRGTIDGEIVYPDGRTAALEITGVEPSSDRHLRARIDRIKPVPAPGRLMWTIRPNSIPDIERLSAILERVILKCEEHGVSNPENLPFDVVDADPDLRWLAWEGFSGLMSGHPVSHDPQVWWMHPIESAVLDSEADSIADGVALALEQEPCVGHIRKLLRDPHAERHLFLIIGTTGLSNAAAFALIESEVVPSSEPNLPSGIDHLWLGPGWGRTVTRWSRGQGWKVDVLPDARAR